MLLHELKDAAYHEKYSCSWTINCWVFNVNYSLCICHDIWNRVTSDRSDDLTLFCVRDKVVYVW
uniref:Putative ovule protein n=1 Tax=Solanum chacoense TaxID=4108 RepID=A0A0V0HLG8_SOLCH